ncbi:unnamed protein product [Ixodes persulcatus]
MRDVALQSIRIHEGVVHKYHGELVIYPVHNPVHQGLEGGWAPRHPKWHPCELKGSLVADQGGLGNVLFAHMNLKKTETGRNSKTTPPDPIVPTASPSWAWHPGTCVEWPIINGKSEAT